MVFGGLAIIDAAINGTATHVVVQTGGLFGNIFGGIIPGGFTGTVVSAYTGHPIVIGGFTLIGGIVGGIVGEDNVESFLKDVASGKYSLNVAEHNFGLMDMERQLNVPFGTLGRMLPNGQEVDYDFYRGEGGPRGFGYDPFDPRGKWQEHGQIGDRTLGPMSVDVGGNHVPGDQRPPSFDKISSTYSGPSWEHTGRNPTPVPTSSYSGPSWEHTGRWSTPAPVQASNGLSVTASATTGVSTGVTAKVTIVIEPRPPSPPSILSTPSLVSTTGYYVPGAIYHLGVPNQVPIPTVSVSNRYASHYVSSEKCAQAQHMFNTPVLSVFMAGRTLSDPSRTSWTDTEGHPHWGSLEDLSRALDRGSFDHSGTNAGTDKGYANDVRPILLDLDGNGIKLTELSNSTTFTDTSGDGLKHRTAWAGAGDGVLFLDADGNGVLSNRPEYVFTE